MSSFLTMALGVGAATPAADAAPLAPVFVDAVEAHRMAGSGALILDARGMKAPAPYLPGAVRADWRRNRAGLLRDGRLVDEETARARYGELGVRPDQPVLVYGAVGAGWGEEGRIWWDLVVLGHREVRILDGGIGAWTRAQFPTTASPSSPAGSGRFEAPLRPMLRADHAAVRGAADAGAPILDARTYDEYWGATPFGSARGGHVPTAHTFHWKRLLRPDGRLLPEPELRELVRGTVGDQARVIAYCTGGVRSAFVVAVLTHLGIEAQNYDGSWWDWSARTELPVEDPREPEPPGE